MTLALSRIGMACIVVLLLIAPAFAGGTSLLRSGYARWFYICGSRTMYVAIPHRDGSVTEFTLSPGDEIRLWIQRGDTQAFRCGGPVDPRGWFLPVTLE